MSTDQSVSRRGFLRAAAGSAAVAGASGTAAAQEGEGGGTTHTVDMTDELIFDPDTLTIAPGDTVVWENVGAVGHSVTAYEDQIPDDAEYFASGGFDSEQAARDAYPEGDIPGGESYEYTFEVEGTYGYFCIPHEAVGMVAELTVQAGAGEAGGEAGAGRPPIPDAAKTIGVATFVAMVATLGLAYTFLKYGGGGGTEPGPE